MAFIKSFQPLPVRQTVKFVGHMHVPQNWNWRFKQDKLVPPGRVCNAVGATHEKFETITAGLRSSMDGSSDEHHQLRLRHKPRTFGNVHDDRKPQFTRWTKDRRRSSACVNEATLPTMSSWSRGIDSTFDFYGSVVYIVYCDSPNKIQLPEDDEYESVPTAFVR